MVIDDVGPGPKTEDATLEKESRQQGKK